MKMSKNSLWWESDSRKIDNKDVPWSYPTLNNDNLAPLYTVPLWELWDPGRRLKLRCSPRTRRAVLRRHCQTGPFTPASFRVVGLSWMIRGRWVAKRFAARSCNIIKGTRILFYYFILFILFYFILFYFFFKKILFIYSWETHTHTQRQRHRQREKQGPCRAPHVGLDPGSLGSHPGPKAALNH